MYRIECESCKQSFSPTELFICQHVDCDDDRKKYCCECGQFLHRVQRKCHSFDISANYTKCVDDLLQPHQSTFDVK